MVTTYTEFQEKLGDARCCLARLSGTYADQLALGLCGADDTWDEIQELNLYLFYLNCISEDDLTDINNEDPARCGITLTELNGVLDAIDLICDDCGC